MSMALRERAQHRAHVAGHLRGAGAPPGRCRRGARARLGPLLIDTGWRAGAPSSADGTVLRQS